MVVKLMKQPICEFIKTYFNGKKKVVQKATAFQTTFLNIKN